MTVFETAADGKSKEAADRWRGTRGRPLCDTEKDLRTMNINIDDWNFKVLEKNTLALDVFLDNGQHGLLEVFPLKNPDGTLNQFPEMVMFGELSGETIQDGQNVARWISRPPQRSCPWSRVQVPPALWQQIAERIALGEHPSAVSP